jgi:hypothetical protein
MSQLDQAISALRKSVEAEDILPAASRARIASACWNDQQAAPFRPTLGRRIWLATLTLTPLALVIAFGFLDNPRVGPEMAGFVGASRAGEAVFFRIQDGPGPHTVTKSTDPSRFNPAASTVVADGLYADRAQSGPVIVFYRID